MELLKDRQQEVILEIFGELDGPVVGFGARLKKLLVNRSADLAQILREPFEQAIYQDRFISNPLSAVLVNQVVGTFTDRNSTIRIETLGSRRESTEPRVPWRIEHDWRDTAQREAALVSLIAPC
jgi:hypothetical protein